MSTELGLTLMIGSALIFFTLFALYINKRG